MDNRSSSRSGRRYYYYEDDRRSPKHPRHHYNRRRSPVRKPHPSDHHQQPQQQQLMVTTCYRILCHDVRAGGVIGKSGSIIKSIRQHTGAWINVHELVPGDEERIIEISDTRRRDPDGRMPSFSPAQEALFLIHERILESEDNYNNNGNYNNNNTNNGNNKAVTRLVVSMMHVGSLLGKGGKIIEQMRIETNTHIRVLPRDHTLPRCVDMSEEIVQVVGDMNAVKSAIAIISSRLRESQHRDRTNFHGRVHSPERFFPPEDDFTPRRLPSGHSGRYENYPSRSSSFGVEPVGGAPTFENRGPISGEDIVFKILCPIDRVERVVGEKDGFFELLQREVGVDIKVADRVSGSNEQIVIITSNEGPDDELFPAQEALLHIQTRIVDLFPEKENIITTRLLVPSGEVGCLDGKNGSLSEMAKLTGTSIEILPREELPVCVEGGDELVQIVGEIKAAREAVVEVTEKLRSCIYQDSFRRDTSAPPFPAPSSGSSGMGMEGAFSDNARDNVTGSDSPAAHQYMQTAKDSGGYVSENLKQTEKERRDDKPTGLNKIALPLVKRSILEVVLPQHAASKLSKNKLSQIGELSGASVKIVEDEQGETEKVIQISGTPEQAERAQSLLQGFILSTQD